MIGNVIKMNEQIKKLSKQSQHLPRNKLQASNLANINKNRPARNKDWRKTLWDN